MTGTYRRAPWQNSENLLLSQLMSVAGAPRDNDANPATLTVFEPQTNDGNKRGLAVPPAQNGCFVYTDKSDSAGSLEQRDANSGFSTLPPLCHVDLFRVPEAYIDYPSPAPSTPTQGFPAIPAADVVGWHGSLPILESAMCTPMLSGAKFMQPEHGMRDGRPATMFVFSDLAVRGAGTFILRYRMIETRPHHPPPLLLGTVTLECFGEPFKVSSPGEEERAERETAHDADAPLDVDRVSSRL